MRARTRSGRALVVAAWVLLLGGGSAGGVEFGAGGGGRFGGGPAPRNMLPKMGREIDAVKAEYKYRGADLTGQSSGGMSSTVAGNFNFERVLEFTAAAKTTAMDKPALLKRISKAFVADMQRQPQATLKLAIGDPGGMSRMVTLKYPDRIVSLIDEGGTWTLWVARANGKAAHEAVVVDHDAGKDVPQAHRRDFIEAAKLLATLTDDALPSKKHGLGPAGR